MRIAMVSEHASPLAVIGGVDAGGQNVHVAALSEHLARAGADVVVHTRRESASDPASLPFCPGVRVDQVDAGPPQAVPKDDLWPHMPAFAASLRRAWEQERPDVVHAHFWMSGWAALQAARPLGVPVVETFHALGVVKRRHQGRRDTSPASRLQTEADVVRDADHIIATCSDEVFELVAMGAHSGRVSVVPCGVDLSRFRSDGWSAPRPPEAARVLVVGRLVERKGIGDVVEALAGVPGAELVVAGGPAPDELDSDPEVARLRGLATAAGVADRVRFLGRVPHDKLPALMRSADVVACTPWYEPFGIVPVEAMACGVPVVASCVGGLVDTVVDGVTGIHVPPRRPDAVAAALRHLLADRGLRINLGRNGASRANRLYGWSRVAESTLATYRRLVRTRLAQGAAR
ncbi:MAG TPA: glycosyltransferase [Acidimicrobiales bacterium]|nr:glycosyltransferase [Acidimicrobiales bacterium]